ncbi:hypothetical protein AMATHDRAFT_248 [Amanita thiersii Skay4041]|uniref:Autophagy-related protein 14 n=1 Tax=Amanita thiersii Skay4041 TaxID=703135 RepID=A0A2A9NUP5_9AGAR|nr:hypothetical protein AMATHDRAFT_248 [Amanita thiersii Skay4041]
MLHDLQDPSSSAPQFTQRRIRHITSFQVHNLTPFPLRDTVASAIAQPAQEHQFNPYGQLSDDLDLTVLKKRSHKISTNSANTRWSIKSDANDKNERDLISEHVKDGKPGSLGAAIVENSVVKPYSTSSLPLRQRRPCAPSAVSFGEYNLSPLGTTSTQPLVPSFTMLPETSQEALENVIKSRLVETCLLVTVFQPSSSNVLSVIQPTLCTRPKNSQHSGNIHLERSNSSQRESPSGLKSSSRRTAKGPMSVSLDLTSSTNVRRSSTRLNGSGRIVNHNKSLSSPARHHDSGSLHRSAMANAEETSTFLDVCTSYMSPIHRPSTNPTFSFDIDHSALSHLELTGNSLKIEVWGRLEAEGDQIPVIHGKGKARQSRSTIYSPEWRRIHEWLVDLQELVPVPPDSSLAPNTLLITFSPFDQTYYTIPQRERNDGSRPLSPLHGYSSDTEYEAKKLGDSMLATRDQRWRRKRPQPGSLNAHEPHEFGMTASMHDLSELVSLQSYVDDCLSSLLQVQREIDKMIHNDPLHPLDREISERNTTVDDLKREHTTILQASAILRERIRRRLKELAQRKDALEMGYKQHAEALRLQKAEEAEVEVERNRLHRLQRLFAPTRTTLLSTLSTIFPIELSSPPDLLYTILDIPLPIPLTPNDPAPPLSMPTQKAVTEEAIATALGYVAQLVQLIAAYLGKGLVYPVVCIGSRSLIRDNISAMVGPRMFPLFARGVDAYRFEYGVFLLNKNINLLMADRDLRALDMRHTLPNLKNLILILTHGEAAELPGMRTTSSSVASVKDVSPTDAEENESTTPKGRNESQASADGTTPPASGATTPTAISGSADSGKATRPFLGLTSLTDLIRLRYSSSHREAAPDLSERNHVVESDRSSKIYDSTGPRNGNVTMMLGTGGPDEGETRDTVEEVDPVDRTMLEDKLGLSPVNATAAITESMGMCVS